MYVEEKNKKYSTVTFAIEAGGNVSLIGLVPSSATPIDKPEEPKTLELANAKADFSQESYAVATAIDGKRRTGWGILPQIGKPQTLQEGSEVVIFACGMTVDIALKAASEINKKHNHKISVVNVFCLKPINEKSFMHQGTEKVYQTVSPVHIDHDTQYDFY